MTRLIANPNRRITLAIALSLLLHGLALWLPKVQVPKLEKELPPLVAKLIPLPKMVGKLASHSHRKIVKKPPPPQPIPAPAPIPEIPIAASTPVAASEPVAASSPIAVSSPVAESSPAAASSVVAASTPAAASSVSAASAPVGTDMAASAPAVSDSESLRPPLPKHARLKFSVYVGSGNFKAGESVHTLDIVDGHFILKADAHTTGLVHVFKTYHIEQTSTGSATQKTLKPETFTEVITQNDHIETKHADFDWANHKIHFSNGSEAALPSKALDILSTLYQFPPMRDENEIITMNIATGDKLETFRFQVDFKESLKTEMGILDTIHFSRLHQANEEGLEIWFAQEYRLLPVKVRHIDRSGKVDGEAVITDIRVSDE